MNVQTGVSCTLHVDKDHIAVVTTVSEALCCIVVVSQCCMLCHASKMLLSIICWTVLPHLQTNRRDIKPVMKAWLVVSIFSGLPWVPVLGLAFFDTIFVPFALPFAVVGLAGLAAAVIATDRFWILAPKPKD